MKTKEISKSAETTGRTIDSWANLYDKLVAVLVSPGKKKRLQTKIFEIAQIKPGEDVLDVGCGTGSLAIAVRKTQEGQGRVVGIDPSANMLEVAVKKADKAQSDVDFRVGVIENLEFSTNQFDVVLSSFMIHHLPDDLKKEGMAEVYRVLKPGGRFVIIDVEPATFSLISLLHGHRQSDGQPSVQSSYREFMGEAGFKNLETGETGVKSLVYITGKKG